METVAIPQLKLSTADTRGPPDVKTSTRLIGILGVFEDTISPDGAGPPSVGDGWLVSDFYLWMNVLRGMGKTQNWITCLDPEYLLNKYCGEDKVEEKTSQAVEDDLQNPYNTWTKGKSGLVHGDPFEERTVVLDASSLPFTKSMIDICSTRHSLREYFLSQLRNVLSSAAESSGATPDPVLILAFCHGDFETGGLIVGATPSISPESYVRISDVAAILAEYPQVKVTLFMTSCYSGHWVISQEFSSLEPAITTAAHEDEESFRFVWPTLMRHADGDSSSAFLHELLKEPEFGIIREGLPEDASSKTARTYQSMTRAVIAEARRLCLPSNVPFYGSAPLFTTAGAHDKFWKRTGYTLHHYKENYNRLAKVPPSDPHPKFDRKTVVDGMIDGNDPRVVAWEQRNPQWMKLFGDADEFADATGGYGATTRGLNSTYNMLFLICQYMNSKPGNDNSGWGIYIKGQIRQFMLGMMSQDNINTLRQLLLFRLQMNQLADFCAKKLRVDKLPPISQWDLRHQKLAGGHHPVASEIMKVIVQSGIFNRPTGKYSGMSGPSYQKPSMYLAYAMMESGYNAEDAKDLIPQIQSLRWHIDDVAKDWKRTEHAKKSLKKLRDVLDHSWKVSKRAHPTPQSDEWMGVIRHEV